MEVTHRNTVFARLCDENGSTFTHTEGTLKKASTTNTTAPWSVLGLTQDAVIQNHQTKTERKWFSLPRGNGSVQVPMLRRMLGVSIASAFPIRTLGVSIGSNSQPRRLNSNQWWLQSICGAWCITIRYGHAARAAAATQGSSHPHIQSINPTRGG